MNLSSHRSIIGVHGASVPIRIYHNGGIPYEHVHSVLSPLFENYYGDQGLRNMFASVDHLWCAYDISTDHCVGCAVVQSEPDRATLYIKLLGVRRMNQGQGVGTRLLDAILSWAKSRRYIAVLLHTQADNYKAIGLYQKLGFHKQAYLPDFFHSQVPLRSLLSGEPNGYLMVANLDETTT